jgi:nucleoside 2-deoxyribosyltransferase
VARRIYLAGPEVFLANANEIGAAKRALCAEFGFEGLYPGEQGGEVTSEAIYRRCLDQMRAADLIVANLTPFRGPGADAGTVFELGYMTALGKPTFAYTNDAADLLARTRRLDAKAHFDAGRQCWIDCDGLMVEAFGLFDNLMLVYGLAAPVVARDVSPPHRYTDLAGFRACLELARGRP